MNGRKSKWQSLLAVVGLGGGDEATSIEVQKPAPAGAVREAASANDSEPGWTRLSGEGLARYNDKDLQPLAQDRMAKLAEWLWQSNLIANRLTELPLAYLLAEGVSLTCKDDDNQTLLNKFWNDPINNWPMKLEARVRALSLLGEQCYITNVNNGNGMVRLGYLDPRQIANVINDPDNPEQPIGVVTKKDSKGRAWKYRVVVIGDDAELFTERTRRIRAEDFADGECFLYQLNKFPDGSRGRSDLLAHMDWLDAYDGFLFGELDRVDDLRRFVWDVKMTGSTQDQVDDYAKKFKPPASNGAFVHNESMELEPKSPSLQAAETSETARTLRNHVLGGATMPEHWYGGGGDVNRAAASEMGEPTFKVYTQRQSFLKRMLEEIGRFVIWKAQSTTAQIDWEDDKFKVTAVFPELVNKDIAKFAAAMQAVATCVIQMIEAGLLTEERGLQLVADVAGRFGQEIDAKQELEAARKEAKERAAEKAKNDTFNLPADTRDLLKNGKAGAPARAGNGNGSAEGV